jgi:hypothetical protein
VPSQLKGADGHPIGLGDEYSGRRFLVKIKWELDVDTPDSVSVSGVRGNLGSRTQGRLSNGTRDGTMIVLLDMVNHPV